MMASESVALKFLGYRSIVDILPGQAVIIQRDSEPIFSQIEEPKSYAPDIFVSLFYRACSRAGLAPASYSFACLGQEPCTHSSLGIRVLRSTRLYHRLDQCSPLARKYGCQACQYNSVRFDSLRTRVYRCCHPNPRNRHNLGPTCLQNAQKAMGSRIRKKSLRLPHFHHARSACAREGCQEEAQCYGRAVCWKDCVTGG